MAEESLDTPGFHLETVIPPQSDFVRRLEVLWGEGRFVCVGLDVVYDRIPEVLRSEPGASVADVVFEFNRRIIDATRDLVCAYKPNAAFYEALGGEGHDALVETVKYAKEVSPEVTVILDAKRNDIGSTSEAYARAVFEVIGVDAVTVNPFLGREALEPFLDRTDKGIIVLARTSNPGAGEFQDLLVGDVQEPLYRVVARRVAEEWNSNGNCALVVGATYPGELAEIRSVAGYIPFLIPGIGAQGGDVEATVVAGKDSRGWGMVINSSRGIIYASPGEDFAEAARKETEKLGSMINKYR